MPNDNQNNNNGNNNSVNNKSDNNQSNNTENSNACNNNSNNQNNNNNSNPGLTNHELLELHELFSSEIIGVKKDQTNISMVQNEELKNFVQESLNTRKNTIQQMQNFINQHVK
ncbi:hypothetical protein [Clostridium magnum]|uniref:Uncharacterized protein n=1 Tax=Clostridium magnum DSM 2767 TaxID=1121326 RepID=A0A162UDJ4_9CLOT|nr:hypothetical protein [Clostridium magnum]KZL93790.1 hypothetical protein CLMAG_08410 [Clostridium magnum DSM 2767]SHI08841.1 hypothetical protein SAMN02745944_02407 [Clostridium magnum DSM 2767]